MKTPSEITKLLKIKSGDGENDPEEDFFLLSDVCTEDKELRLVFSINLTESLVDSDCGC